LHVLFPVNHPFNPQKRRHRATLASMVIAIAICTLSAAFFRAQVLRGSDFTLRADDNRYRSIPVPTLRGTIRDRNGEVIAESLIGHAVSLEPAPMDSIRARTLRLADVLKLDSATIEQVFAIASRRPIEPVLVWPELSFEQVSYIEERRSDFPGVLLEPRPIRRYPHGPVLAHLLGYVGEINRKELADSAWGGYSMGTVIGRTGIERFYEKRLGGTPGARFVEVDARGTMVGRFAAQHFVEPVPGENLQLTIDLPLQSYIHQTFPQDRRGAVVVMAPKTGEVLALYSYPTFDPNLLVGRITPENWNAVNNHPGRPLLNRAVHGRYAPASTWKLVTAMVGLERGLITPTSRMPIPCTGGMTYAGRYSRCWNKYGHGSVDVLRAIQHSCNVYFYQLGVWIGLDLLTREGTRLGFGRPTGIDMPGEKTGTFPADRAWYRKQFGRRPAPSEVMHLAIGQGPNNQTPLRIAQFYAALATDGKVPAPHLLLRDGPPAPPETDLRASPQTLAVMRDGLARVTGRGGTAQAVALRRWQLSGKTGTSQNTQDLKRPHAWFAGFAGPPGQEPEVVISVIVEFGESGSDAAAPIASRIANFYLNQKHSKPPVSTLVKR
jgi:penicillin-binding protein 2